MKVRRKPKAVAGGFPWGRFKGEPWETVPSEYLQRMLHMSYGSWRQQMKMRKELERRGEA